MAISIDGALGYTAGTTGQTSVTVNPTNVGDLMTLFVRVRDISISITDVTGGNVGTWSLVAATEDASRTATLEMWAGTATATGSATATISYSTAIGAVNVIRTLAKWTAGLGASTVWTLDDFGAIDKVTADTTIDYPSLDATGTGELYAGFCYTNGVGVAGSSPGFTYTNDTNSDQLAYNTSASGTVDPAATHSGAGASITVAGLFIASAGGASPDPLRVPIQTIRVP